MPHATMEHRILVLQIFLWTTVATTLPIGSLLDERRAAQREAHTNQTIYRLLLDHAEDMIVLATLDGSSRFVSPAVERVLGWTQQQYAALPPNGRVHPDDEAQVHSVVAGLHRGEADHSMRYRAPTRDGSYRWMHAFVHGYREAEGGPITGYVATIQDISVLKENEDSWSAEKHALASENEQLAELAGRDELTGIANRRTFNQALAIECSRQNRAGDCVSLLMIDVDSFKKFNDCYGHQAGDACLQKVARVLEGCAARSEDLAARFGGEEFAVLLPQTESAAAVRVGQCILDAVRGLRMEHAETAIGYLTVSIGIATWKSGERMSSTQLVEQADAALYESKRAGRDRLTLYPAAAEPGAQRHRATLP
jgi:diguanylate cyclase (GGDEF)-like protein/PAS domain S-box-containing protein